MQVHLGTTELTIQDSAIVLQAFTGMWLPRSQSLAGSDRCLLEVPDHRQHPGHSKTGPSA